MTGLAIYYKSGRIEIHRKDQEALDLLVANMEHIDKVEEVTLCLALQPSEAEVRDRYYNYFKLTDIQKFTLDLIAKREALALQEEIQEFPSKIHVKRHGRISYNVQELFQVFRDGLQSISHPENEDDRSFYDLDYDLKEAWFCNLSSFKELVWFPLICDVRRALIPNTAPDQETRYRLNLSCGSFTTYQNSSGDFEIRFFK